MIYQVFNIRFKASIQRSELCDFSNAYTVVKLRISVAGNDNANRRSKKLPFKINDPFIS